MGEQRPSRGGEATTRERDSPNAVDVFADLARVRDLKLAQLRISLDLEEDLLSVLGKHLARDASVFTAPEFPAQKIQPLSTRRRPVE